MGNGRAPKNTVDRQRNATKERFARELTRNNPAKAGEGVWGGAKARPTEGVCAPSQVKSSSSCPPFPWGKGVGGIGESDCGKEKCRPTPVLRTCQIRPRKGTKKNEFFFGIFLGCGLCSRRNNGSWTRVEKNNSF